MFYGAQKVKDPALLYMRAQNLELTRSIAESYYYEPAHAKAMELYSYVIIRAFDRYNGLNERDEFLLRMAIILSRSASMSICSDPLPRHGILSLP